MVFSATVRLQTREDHSQPIGHLFLYNVCAYKVLTRQPLKSLYGPLLMMILVVSFLVALLLDHNRDFLYLRQSTEPMVDALLVLMEHLSQ